MPLAYHLKPIAKTCAATGKEFVPGAECYSALVERDGQWIRLDYTEQGWSGPPQGTIGHWQSVVPKPSEAKARPLDADALMRNFEQICEDASPSQDKFRYVLSLLLLQKRRLTVDGSRQEGEVEYLQLSGTRGEGSFEVCDQNLQDEEIETLQRNLNAHLSAE